MITKAFKEKIEDRDSVLKASEVYIWGGLTILTATPNFLLYIPLT